MSDLPVISNIAGDPALSGKWGNFYPQCDVSAVNGVSRVWCKIRRPDNTLVEITLLHQSGTTYKGEHIFDQSGIHDFMYYAEDRAGVRNVVVPTGHYTKIDPAIINRSVNGYVPTCDTSFNISCDVFPDSSGLDKVWCTIKKPDYSYIYDWELNHQSGSTYSRIYTFPDDGRYDFWYYAEDLDGDKTYAYSGRLEKLKVFVGYDVTGNPKVVTGDNTIDFSCNVQSQFAIDKVWVVIAKPDLSMETVFLTSGGGTNYTYSNYSLNLTGEYRLDYYGEDIYGNKNFPRRAEVEKI